MSVIQERLQINKREPLDKWSVREKLCLASAVAKSGDQNWISVSRVLKPFADPNRPIDWFHQKNCAAQYNWLLETMDVPKRKKRESGGETPIEIILRKLTQERLAEIEKCLVEEKAEYLKMQEDMALLKSGNVTMEMLNKWCREIDEENKRQEEEAAAHSQWLREREARKQEIERNLRPIGKPTNIGLSLKRKASDSLELDEDSNKPALSPLLTSLLKSPSQNISTAATILNTSIAGATVKINHPTTNPTIASILNSPHALQQLALQDPIAIASDMLEDTVDSLPNIKVDDLESTLLSSDDPLPVMKNEDVEVIISNLIQSNVGDDLKLDDVNVDIIANLQNELEEYCKEEEEKHAAAKIIDPFEFQEDPAICDIPKPSSFNGTTIKSVDKVLQDDKCESSIIVPNQIVNEQLNYDKFQDKELTSGSVEIVEVVVMDAPDIDKELDKTQIQDIVHSISLPHINEIPSVIITDTAVSIDDVELNTPGSVEQSQSETNTITATEIVEPDTISDDNNSDKGIFHSVEESVFDDIMKVNKHDDSSKRDYSRKKKDLEKDFDVSLATEKVVNNEPNISSPSASNITSQPDENIKKVKANKETSNSPWNEEEDTATRAKRRYSAPGTPVESTPISPASSGAYFEDDRDYRNWKKSVMLVYGRLTTHKYASLFLKPITDEQAPGYHYLIYKPIDLQTIRKNIENGTIRTTLELRRDVFVMFTNAIMYNNTQHFVYNMAKDMQLECIQHLDILSQAQLGETSHRRETRTSEPTNKRKRPIEENTRNKRKKED